MAQVALAWLRARPVPIIPIIGARKLSQLQDNVGSFDLSISADHLKALDERRRAVRLGFEPLGHRNQFPFNSQVQKVTASSNLLPAAKPRLRDFAAIAPSKVSCKISQNRSPAGFTSPLVARAMPTDGASVVPAERDAQRVSATHYSL
jgi:hypothetical protein